MQLTYFYSVLFLIPAGEDFNAPNLAVSFPIGSVNFGLLPVTFSITDDNAFEKDHSFTVGIVSVEDNVVIGAQSTTTVTIIDNDGNRIRSH